MKTETETVVPEQECRKVARLIRIAIGIEVAYWAILCGWCALRGRSMRVDDVCGVLSSIVLVFSSVALFNWLACAIKRGKNWARVTFICAAVVLFLVCAALSGYLAFDCCDSRMWWHAQAGILSGIGKVVLVVLLANVPCLICIYACVRLLRKRVAHCFVASRGWAVRVCAWWVLVIGMVFAGLNIPDIAGIYLLALSGDPSAQGRLAMRYNGGYGIVRSREKAEEWYLKAANQGDKWAQIELADFYRHEAERSERSYKESARWYRQAAKRGFERAQYRLGSLYEKGKGVEQSFEKAAKWYCKAAEQGHEDAVYKMGELYEKGLGVKQSYESAMKWYRKAAEQGNGEAMCKMGALHEEGRGAAQSYEEAEKWYMKAVERGEENPDAAYRLGALYEKWSGVAQSHEKAMEWYAKAAEWGCANAARRLGELYEKGAGVAQSSEKAVKWYAMAVENHLYRYRMERDAAYDSACKLIELHENGRVVPQVNEEVSKRYRQVAELLEWISKRTKEKDDDDDVVPWRPTLRRQMSEEWTNNIREAAEGGIPFAQRELGWMYEFGMAGVAQSYEEAIKWYRKAIDGFRKQLKAIEEEEE